MAGRTSSDVVLSDLGTRVFLVDANMEFSATPEAITDMQELEDVISIDNLGYSRDTADYPILANGGYPKKALLSYSVDDLSMSLVRSEQGAYNDGSTFWILNQMLENFKVNKAFRGLIVCRPVANVGSDADAFEARYYTVACTGIEDGATNDTGREYTCTLLRSGKPIDLTVEYTENPETFKFALKDITVVDGQG